MIWDYQRTIFGYHGCDRAVADAVLRGRTKSLSASQNSYDWLGSGIYFWEHGPERAFDWAREISKLRPDRIKKPAVIGAVIHLGNCFDLLDRRYTSLLRGIFPAFESYLEKTGQPIPQNKAVSGRDHDLVRRELDCAVLNWAIPFLEDQLGERFHSVRGVFVEGESAFPGSRIYSKSHIQIAIRDAACIIGYFRPKG